MRRIFILTGKFISDIIDFFYPPFRKYFSLHFFRYSVSGASNMGFDWVLYFITYNFIVQKQLVHLGFVTLSPHIASLLFTFPITFFTGFLLQKYVTFTASQMRGKDQLVRYMAVVMANLLINYFGLKLFVEVIGIYPTPSKMLVTIITTAFSYFSQKKFTFRIQNEPEQK
ncbi:MAG: GtrA family protein [Porphyromonadaceae bacterium]|nr:GtrA family protein [Porphyromonadaceae bacterium]